MQLQGRATVLGDDVDTDVIFPGRYLAVLDPKEQGKHLFENLGDLRERAIAGGVLVCGWNFGCGSSREHAVTSMIGAGIRFVLARSFSRIYFRNAVNNGLAVVACPEAVDAIADGDEVAVDLVAGVVKFPNGEARFPPLPPELLHILSAGGLWASRAAGNAAPRRPEAGASSGATRDRPRTLAEKIMSRCAGRSVYAGEFVELAPDWTFSLDDGIGLVDRYFKLHAVERIAAPEKIALFYDHFAPADTPQHAYVQRLGRQLCERFGVTRLYDVGEGISHQVAVETGLVLPGQMVTNTDSHTLTTGAIGAVGCGIGVAEMAYLWAYGTLWFQVPRTLKIELTGRLPRGVTAKDLVLTLVERLSARGAHYASIEYHGSALADLGIPDRMTLCNMGIEMGAKFAVVPGDAVTREHYSSLGIDVGAMVQPDPGASYFATHTLDVATVEPKVSAPSKVDNVHPVSAFGAVEIHQAFLGTCTNGRYEDLAAAARILKGKRIAPTVRLVVTPASRKGYLRALEDGVVQTLVAAGATVTTPGCGACAGIHQGVLAADEVCISSGSRNFVGRMGNRAASIYLASPATVAASALTGRITDPRSIPD